MIKTFHFPIPQVTQHSERRHTFLPTDKTASIRLYESEKLQLVDFHQDHHCCLIYRIEAHVRTDCILPLHTDKSDFHLLYIVQSPCPIQIQNKKSEEHIQFPNAHGSYAYVPKGNFEIHLQAGHYLVYGLLIDVGFIREQLYHKTPFLQEYRNAKHRDKKKLYQSPIWPIKEKTSYQIQRIEEVFFHYQPEHESEVIKLLYSLFEIAKQKQFKHYDWIDPNEALAKKIRLALENQVNQVFSYLFLNKLSEQFAVKQKRLLAVHKQYFNQTMEEYLHELLIRKAKEKLALYTVSETANYCGYSDLSSFSDFFLREVGMRPSTYQRAILKSQKNKY